MGLNTFISGSDSQVLTMEGIPIDPSTSTITLEPYMLNLISYLPSDCIATDDVFAFIEDNILLVKDDQGGYYVPTFGVMTMTEMCPGESYSVFLMGSSQVDFIYPSTDGMAREKSQMHAYWREYNNNTRTKSYQDLVVPTGISYPIIIRKISGEVSVGDELVAYANGQVVGATRIVDLSAPVVLSAWGGFHSYGVDLEGYTKEDLIDLRLYSAKEGKELLVTADLDYDQYEEGIFSSGTATVSDMLVVPEEYALSQNYPNPFNPSTTISFSVPVEGNVVLSIYDITGRLVSTLVDKNMSDGYHQVTWDSKDMTGSSVSAGLYIYSLQAEGVSLTRKMVLMK